MSNKRKNSPGKNIVIYITSFVLSLCLVFVTAILTSGVTLFNDRDLMSRVSGTTYFSELNNEIVTRCKTIAIKSGIDYEAVESVITSGRIDADFTVYFNSITSENPKGGRKTIDTETLKSQLYESIVAYDSDITEEEKANALIIAEKMAKEYESAIVIENFENYISIFEKYKEVSRYILYILIALFVYCVCVIVFINGKQQKHRLFRRFAVVTGSTGLTVLTFTLLIRFSGILERITFASTLREYNLFMDFFDDFISMTMRVGVCWVGVCIVLIVFWYLSVTGRIRK